MSRGAARAAVVNDVSVRGLRTPTSDPEHSRFLSEQECAALAARVATFRTGGGESRVQIDSSWRETICFARNTIQSSGDRRNTNVSVTRNIEGAERTILGNQIDDVSLRAMVRRAERLIKFEDETGDARFQTHVAGYSAALGDAARNSPSVPASPEKSRTNSNGSSDADGRTDWGMGSRVGPRDAYVLNVTALPPEPFDHPTLFCESTIAVLSSPQRAALVAPLVADAVKAGMLAAGDIEVFATGTAVMDTWGNHLYYPKTDAYYTVTVRSPDGSGSGWAGVNWNDWARIDGVKLSQIALDKCLRSKNPVRIEPGHYTAVLEPQAVHQLFAPIIGDMIPLDDPSQDLKLGDKILDERITVHADPMDPDCGFLPFDLTGDVYHPATWFERGHVTAYPYTRHYALRRLHQTTGLPNSGAYHLASGTTSLEEMIATTERGVLVTHFFVLSDGNPYWNIPAEGYTRDGTWLIERGKITKPINNLKFIAPHFPTFNRVEQIGPAQRVFAFPNAAVVPPMKIRDFNFTALTNAA